MNTAIKTSFIITSFLFMTLQQSNAENSPSNSQIPSPVWVSNQTPIPAPIYASSNGLKYILPPPSPFFNSPPTQTIITPQMYASNNSNSKEKPQTLKAHDESSKSAFKNKISELSQALKDAQNQVSDSHKTIDSASIKNAAQQDEIVRLEKQLQTIKQKATSLQSQLDSKETSYTLKDTRNNETITSLKKKLSNVENINISLKTQLSSAKKNATHQARILTSVKRDAAELVALKSTYKKRNDENAELKNKLSKLEKEAGNTQPKQTAMTLKRTQNDEIIAELKKKLSDFKNNNITLKTQLDSATSTTSSQIRKINALNQNTAELTAIQSAYKERNNENVELKKKVYDLDNTNKSLVTQLSTASSRIAVQTKKLHELSPSVAELEVLKSTYKERNDENVELKIKLSKFESMQRSLQTTSTKLIDLQNKLSNSEDQRKTLLGKISTLETTSSNQARRITLLMATTDELDALKSAYKNLSSEKVELNTQLEAATADSDNDGVIDNSDKCPASPSGSSVNKKGCPDIDDADIDGIADSNDFCPNSVIGATVNKFGCIATENITLKGVNFATGSAHLTANSLPIINAVALTLSQNPNINIEIAGYTDNQGVAYMNKRLSKRRANAVMIQLIKQGVNADRLTASGYGEKNFIADNNTEEGRSTNRRVELKIRQ